MASQSVPAPEIVSPDVWREKRLALLTKEKELTKHHDSVSAERRRLPMAKVEKAYVFDAPGGSRNLADLFEGRRQLIVYHFMFDPAWTTGCMGCTGFIDALGDLSMLGERETTFAVVSRAPIEKLEAYKAEKGWTIAWYSSFGSDFNHDFHVTNDDGIAPMEYNYRTEVDWKRIRGEKFSLRGEEHGVSVFFQMDGDVFHTYSSYGRGTENLTNSYELLDVTPYGRQEDWEDSPNGWPQRPTYG